MNSLDVYVQPVGPTAVALLVGVLVTAMAWWLYRAVDVDRRRRRILVLLRLLAALVAVLVLFRPALVYTEVRRRSATLYVLVDRSKSMTVADAPGDVSRWDAVQKALRRAQPLIEDLARVLDVRVVYFDREAYLDEAPPAEEPTGEATAIGDVLRQVGQQGGKRVAAIVLFSDGASNSGRVPPLEAAEMLRSLRVPVFTVGVGKSSISALSRDIGLRSIEAGPVVFAGTRMPVTGDLFGVGFPGARVSVSLIMDGQSVANEVVRLDGSPVSRRVTLETVPRAEGEHKVGLRAQLLEQGENEAVTTNNLIETWVTVQGGGIRVLIVDGSPETWEATFLKRSLDSAREIQAVLVRATSADKLQQALRAVDFENVDVLLVRDVPATWIPNEIQQKIAERVDRGMGFALLGGRRSFGPGQWGTSALADLIPVEVHPADPQIEEPLKLVPTPEGLVHFVLRVGATDADTRLLWDDMPPLRGASTVGDVKPGARVLATDERNRPLLVAQEVGGGRTLAFAGDTTWQWHLYSDAGRSVHRRFWRQVVLWLARREDLEGRRAWLELATRRVRAGESLEITAGAEDEEGNFITDARYNVTVVDPDGETRDVRLYFQGDRMRGVFWDTGKAGDYTVRLTVERDGQVLAGPLERRFLAYQEDLELVAPAANLELLSRIAEITGGEFALPEEVNSLFESLRSRDFRLEVRRRSVVRLWDRWPVLLLFVALLCSEWYLRKRWGLP